MEKLLKMQRRFFRKEKNKFLDAVEEKLIEYGYESERKEFKGILKSVNLETKSAQPDLIFIAHYDTGTIMPFWISWLMKLCGINNQILMLIPLFIFFVLLSGLGIQYIAFQILYLIFALSFLFILIPNRKNLDDNTSGVIALLSLAKKCKENNINNVKFIFVDNEELGLIGSDVHRKYLEKKRLIFPHSKIISIDCVGFGDFPIIIRNSKSDYEPLFYNELQNKFGVCKSIKMVLPCSDNYSFKRYGALNISFVNKAIVPSGYYIPRIHSPKDNSIDLNKIESLTDVLVSVVSSQ